MRRKRGTRSPDQSGGSTVASAPTTLPLLYVYGAWAITVFGLHFFLGGMVAPVLGRLGTIAYLPLIVMLLVQGPAIMASARSWVWYPPFFLLLAVAGVTIPTAPNNGFARETFQFLLVYYVLAFATAVYVRSARQARPILLMLAFQFLWWAIWAQTKGLVPWHPTLANFDGFGGLMVQGAGICFWFGMAARSPRLKVLMFALAAYCVVGVVASQGRGAFLALVVLGIWVWIRSPHKVLTAIGAVAGAVIVVAASRFLFDEGFFWTEISSAFSEGTEAGTGGLRWASWKAAFRVFLEHPIFGVGGGNFGVFASSYFRPGEIEMFPNPAYFYGLNLHNAYVQILCEHGIVGTFAFGWIVVDFLRRNRALLTPESAARWKERAGPGFDLRHIALGLEAGFVGTFLANLVYASLLEPWFVTIWAANRMLWAVTRPDPRETPVPAPTRAWARRNRRG